MLMTEAQKLQADDIINVRIDVTKTRTANQVRSGEAKGAPVRTVITTTYDYTATALAIKYTNAVIMEVPQPPNRQE
jgi:uncharacterized protein YbjQ (UPF0145 family)